MLLLIGTALVSLTSACSSEAEVDPAIVEARELWESQGLDDYEYDITFVSFIEDDRHTVRVEGGIVVSERVGAAEANLTVDEMFDLLERLDLDEDALIAEASFDPVTGVPTFVNVEEDVAATDTGYFWTIEEFRPD